MSLSDPPPHEVRPCADPNDAGTSWRAEKLKDLVWRAKCLGVRDLPAVQALEREMRDATAVLDAMAVEQSAPEYARPWWKDGEYDEARAEAANDRGMEAYAERRFRDAHAAFTEAARLEPRRAGYHANRAAVSLKLGDHRAAAEDAENALLFDEAHVKAMLRFGEAALRGRLDPRRALARFQDARARAEELGRPRDAALAARGEARAKEAVSAADASDARADASARAGDSAPLPDHESWPDLDSAAEDALSAEATFRANPRSARFATRAAEAYVSCGAPKRALEALRGFEDIVVGGREDASDRRVPNARARRGLDLGVNADFAYARASAQWRAGDLAGAVAGLGAFAAAAAADNRRRRNAGLPSVPPPAKIVSLGARLDRLRELRDRGVDALDDGRPDVAARAFGEALATTLARPLWFRRRPDDAERRNANRKRTPYPNAARGELLRRRAEALLEALDQRVDVDVDGCDPGSETETADAPSDADASEEGDFAARDDGGDGGDGASTTRARGALHLAARDLRESLLIDPGDVEARRARVRLRRSIGDTLGAFDDARAALDAAPGDEALNRAARELAAEATRRGDGDSSSSDGFRDGAKSAVPRGPVPAAYRALGVSRDADARSIRRAYRRAAAKWHPDKWTMRSEAERETAAAAFRRVAGAYEALGDAKRRRAYDADPERFPID